MFIRKTGTEKIKSIDLSMDWTEDEHFMGEMQAGFRRGRKGEDNLFVPTSTIELSRAQGTGLVCVFLFCTAAYDRENRGELWKILIGQGMDRLWVNLLQHLYAGNRCKVQYGKYLSEWIDSTEGLRQSCPLSPILFMLYINHLEAKLQESKCGFRVRTKGNFWNVKERKFFWIPDLLFADDLVLMGQDADEVEKVLDITTEFGNEMDLTYNPAKSAIAIYSGNRAGNASDLRIQGKTSPVSLHKYLSITILDSCNYLDRQGDIWREGAEKVPNRHASGF